MITAKMSEAEDTELHKMARLYEKLKDFYAQPIDGYWPLRPKWIPDITKRHRYKAVFSSEPPMLHAFRRFTFQEFCEIYRIRSREQNFEGIYDCGD